MCCWLLFCWRFNLGARPQTPTKRAYPIGAFLVVFGVAWLIPEFALFLFPWGDNMTRLDMLTTFTKRNALRAQIWSIFGIIRIFAVKLF